MSKILIAEDDPVSRRLVTKIVEELGHIVFVSPDGRHAYETLMVNDGFDLLISDMMMPGMDGDELVRTLRDSSRHKDLPVIIVSAVHGQREVRDLIESGVTYFLPKPVKTKNLVDYIGRCLSVPA